jgi:hypothetical protein
MCKGCRHQSTVTAGTIFEKTRTPLRVWLAAAWYLTNQKQGVSALGLQRVLGLGSYQTAWMMLHRFRCAMVRAGRNRLQGVVEVDEAYIAVTDRENTIPRQRRKSCTDKVLIGVAVEIRQPKGFGRIRLGRLPSDSKECVRQFIQDSVEPGSVVRTDGSGSYAKLDQIGHPHERHVMYGSDIPAHVSMAGVHRVASLLKRWILGTHHGSIQPRLSRRVRIPLQSPRFGVPRHALLPSTSASRGDRSGDLSGYRLPGLGARKSCLVELSGYPL